MRDPGNEQQKCVSVDTAYSFVGSIATSSSGKPVHVLRRQPIPIPAALKVLRILPLPSAEAARVVDPAQEDHRVEVPLVPVRRLFRCRSLMTDRVNTAGLLPELSTM